LHVLRGEILTLPNNVLKVIVVDDTVIYRKILKDVISEMEDVIVIDTTLNGELAIKKVEFHQPDLVILDIEMPIMDGLTALTEIKKRFPSVGVIIVSGITKHHAQITLEALRKGAFDFIAKPQSFDIEDNITHLRDSLQPIVSHFVRRKRQLMKSPHAPHIDIDMVGKAKAEHIIHREEKIKKKTKEIDKEIDHLPLHLPIRLDKGEVIEKVPSIKPRRIDVIVIGISTGGPGALHTFIPALSGNIGVPILLVQHMPAEFTKSLAEHLDAKSDLEVIEAEDGDLIVPNVVYIAPGGKHMVVSKGTGKPRIAITNTPPINSCKPSVDVLFESIPTVYPRNVLALIMTGMGADGCSGVRRLKSIPSHTITQTEDSCIVYGMPRVINEAGLSDEHVSLENMAKRVEHIVKYGL
jgi:two-component system chemotaxis response regulator CheB